MTLDEAIEFSNSNNCIDDVWRMKKEIYREEYILKGKHITETSSLLKNIYENFSYNDYELINKAIYKHLKNTKDDIFLSDSSYYIHEYGDCLYITVYSKFKNYPKHFEQYLSIHKNV